MHIARWMVALVAVYSCGGVVADFIVPSTASQHMGNPRWPGHAKFHNAQGFLLGIACGLISVCLLFAITPLTRPNFLAAAASASAFWVTAALAPLFPGAAWYDPEFQDASARPLGLSPQQILAYGFCSLTAVAIVIGLTFD